jgi:hypothetical protein
LEPVRCSGIYVDYNNIICNGKKSKIINNNGRIYLILDQLKKGNNIIKYKIIPKYYGRFILYGNSLFDPTDLSNCLTEDTVFIDIK